MRRWAFAAVLLSGCGHTIFTPLEGDPRDALPGDVKAEFCRADSAGKFPLTTLVIAEKHWDGDVALARGGGCVGRSLRDTHAALHNRDALHWVGTELLGFARIPDDRVPFLFETKYKAGPGIFAQKWTMQWYHSGDERRVFVRFKKTEGTSHIPKWDGTIELVPVAENVTGFAMRNEIQATRTGLDESEGSVRDQLERARTVAPDHTYLD